MYDIIIIIYLACVVAPFCNWHYRVLSDTKKNTIKEIISIVIFAFYIIFVYDPWQFNNEVINMVCRYLGYLVIFWIIIFIVHWKVPKTLSIIISYMITFCISGFAFILPPFIMGYITGTDALNYDVLAIVSVILALAINIAVYQFIRREKAKRTIELI